MAQLREKECPVCTNDFTTPKILPCGHLLCRECVISLLDSKPQAGCPLCRCPIVEQSGQSGRSSSETVDGLLTDVVMEALVESARVLSKDHLCCVCEDVRADFICMQCQDMMCSSCSKVHSKLSVSRSHEVESLSTVTPERLAASRPALCADHGDNLAEYFCHYHRLAVCKSCKSSKHRECPKVSDLDDEIESAQQSLKGLTNILVKAEQKLEQAIGQVTSSLQEVDVSEKEDMAQVDKTCDRLQKMLADFCKKLKEKIRLSHLEIRNRLGLDMNALRNRLRSVTSHKRIVTQATAVSPRAKIIYAKDALSNRLSKLDFTAEVHEWEKPFASAICCQEFLNRIEKELLVLEQLKWNQQAPVFDFHEMRGCNIRLTNCNTTVENIEPGNWGGGLVVSRDAMIENILYEVRVDKVSNKETGVCTGVSTIPPAHMIWTEYSADLKDSIIIYPYAIFRQGTTSKSRLGKGLSKVDVGSRVGVLVDSSNNLHLYVDGKDQGIAARDVTQPCFAVFDISYYVIQVTALPRSRWTRRISENKKVETKKRLFLWNWLKPRQK